MATVRINNAIVKGISSPDSIRRIADERGLNPQEVFVRLIFEVNGTEYSASNQLRFIGKKDYQKLVNHATKYQLSFEQFVIKDVLVVFE